MVCMDTAVHEWRTDVCTTQSNGSADIARDPQTHLSYNSGRNLFGIVLLSLSHHETNKKGSYLASFFITSMITLQAHHLLAQQQLLQKLLFRLQYFLPIPL